MVRFTSRLYLLAYACRLLWPAKDSPQPTYKTLNLETSLGIWSPSSTRLACSLGFEDKVIPQGRIWHGRRCDCMDHSLDTIAPYLHVWSSPQCVNLGFPLGIFPPPRASSTREILGNVTFLLWKVRNSFVLRIGHRKKAVQQTLRSFHHTFPLCYRSYSGNGWSRPEQLTSVVGRAVQYNLSLRTIFLLRLESMVNLKNTHTQTVVRNWSLISLDSGNK